MSTLMQYTRTHTTHTYIQFTPKSSLITTALLKEFFLNLKKEKFTSLIPQRLLSSLPTVTWIPDSVPSAILNEDHHHWSTFLWPIVRKNGDVKNTSSSSPKIEQPFTYMYMQWSWMIVKLSHTYICKKIEDFYNSLPHECLVFVLFLHNTVASFKSILTTAFPSVYVLL